MSQYKPVTAKNIAGGGKPVVAAPTRVQRWQNAVQGRMIVAAYRGRRQRAKK